MTQTRPFNSRENLDKLLDLRRRGYTLKSLAWMFGVDFSSIYHHTRGKPHGVPVTVRLPDILSASLLDVSSILETLGIRSRREKTYAEYLEDSRARDGYPNGRRLPAGR